MEKVGGRREMGGRGREGREGGEEREREREREKEREREREGKRCNRNVRMLVVTRNSTYKAHFAISMHKIYKTQNLEKQGYTRILNLATQLRTKAGFTAHTEIGLTGRPYPRHPADNRKEQRQTDLT